MRIIGIHFARNNAREKQTKPGCICGAIQKYWGTSRDFNQATISYSISINVANMLGMRICDGIKSVIWRLVLGSITTKSAYTIDNISIINLTYTLLGILKGKIRL